MSDHDDQPHPLPQSTLGRAIVILLCLLVGAALLHVNLWGTVRYSVDSYSLTHDWPTYGWPVICGTSKVWDENASGAGVQPLLEMFSRFLTNLFVAAVLIAAIIMLFCLRRRAGEKATQFTLAGQFSFTAAMIVVFALFSLEKTYGWTKLHNSEVGAYSALSIHPWYVFVPISFGILCAIHLAITALCQVLRAAAAKRGTKSAEASNRHEKIATSDHDAPRHRLPQFTSWRVIAVGLLCLMIGAALLHANLRKTFCGRGLAVEPDREFGGYDCDIWGYGWPTICGTVHDSDSEYDHHQLFTLPSSPLCFLENLLAAALLIAAPIMLFRRRRTGEKATLLTLSSLFSFAVATIALFALFLLEQRFRWPNAKVPDCIGVYSSLSMHPWYVSTPLFFGILCAVYWMVSSAIRAIIAKH